MKADDIVEVVSSQVVLNKHGIHYLGKCPWHDDPRPSLSVNTRRNTFFCFMCGRNGSPEDFRNYLEGAPRSENTIKAKPAKAKKPAKKRGKKDEASNKRSDSSDKTQTEG